MSQGTQVVILMATYNGEKYLSEQVESVLKQTYVNWLLIIRDDGSTDKTVDLINKYSKENKNIIQLNCHTNKKGSLFNFATLYSWAKQNVNPKYIMFCDQDDIWKPNKIESSVIYMQKMEQIYNDSPLLLYTDLELIDGGGKKLGVKINVLHELTLNKVIAQNYCFGCTMLLNEKLIKIVDSISVKAENHDYWVALTATVFGYSIFLDEPGVLYRQHGDNVTSQGNSLKNRFNRYTKGLNKKINTIGTTMVMLKDFYNRYEEEIDVKNKIMIQQYLESYKKGFVYIVFTIFKHKIFRLNLLQNLAFLFLIYKYLKIKQLAAN